MLNRNARLRSSHRACAVIRSRERDYSYCSYFSVRADDLNVIINVTLTGQSVSG